MNLNASLIVFMAPMNRQLMHLAPIDMLILVLYFILVIFIGFYVKGSTNTSEEFYLAGREMTAWVAGLSFVSKPTYIPPSCGAC
jgi:solute:Na+ symporter, SSS family